MTFPEFIRSLTDAQLEQYAKDCGTTSGYIKVHLMHGRKYPKKELMKALSAKSNGLIRDVDVLVHFGLLETDSLEHTSLAAS